MSTLYEHYNSGDNSDEYFYKTLGWAGQSFSSPVTHKLVSIKIKLKRQTVSATPGTVTARIYLCGSDDKPVGNVLGSGTTDGNTVSYTTPEWREPLISGNITITAGLKYGIVLSCESDDNYQYGTISWRREAPYGGYANGKGFDTANQGISWTVYDYDEMFEEWGDPPGWQGKISGVTNPAKVMGVDKANIAKVKGVASA